MKFSSSALVSSSLVEGLIPDLADYANYVMCRVTYGLSAHAKSLPNSSFGAPARACNPIVTRLCARAIGIIPFQVPAIRRGLYGIGMKFRTRLVKADVFNANE